MTKLCFFEEGGKIVKFCCSGHSGYAEAGSDIVCAAVSAAVSVAVSAINDVADVGAKVRRAPDKARISLELPVTLSKEQEVACETVMRAFYMTMKAQSGEYGEYLKVALKQKTLTEE